MQPGGAACPAVSGKDGGHSVPAFQQGRGAFCPGVSAKTGGILPRRFSKDGGHSAPPFQQGRGAFCPPGPPEGIWIRLKHDGRVFPSRM